MEFVFQRTAKNGALFKGAHYPVCTEKLDPHVVVMKPAKDWA
jgi:hypothetical protein